MDDPNVTILGGAIGAYFDYCDENRAIAAQLGGIDLLVENIYNNFHGQYSEWAYEPVKQSLFGLSSGCWGGNQGICHGQGFPQLAVNLMTEHGGEDKIAEETCQAMRAIMHTSDAWRIEYSQLGAAQALGGVIQAMPQNQGAVDLACINLGMMIGPWQSVAPPATPSAQLPFIPEVQANATAAGALGIILNNLLQSTGYVQTGHSSFNFDTDASYNVNRDCFFALVNFGWNNIANVNTMVQAGLYDYVVGVLSASPADPTEWGAGCALLLGMASGTTGTVSTTGSGSVFGTSLATNQTANAFVTDACTTTYSQAAVFVLR